MEIEKLSIADLKADWDFAKEDLKELAEKAKKENVSTDKIPAYEEVKTL